MNFLFFNRLLIISHEMEKSLSLLFNQLGFHFHILLYRNKEKNMSRFIKANFELITKPRITASRFVMPQEMLDFIAIFTK